MSDPISREGREYAMGLQHLSVVAANNSHNGKHHHPQCLCGGAQPQDPPPRDLRRGLCLGLGLSLRVVVG
jgi:hypothetical protein